MGRAQKARGPTPSCATAMDTPLGKGVPVRTHAPIPMALHCQAARPVSAPAPSQGGAGTDGEGAACSARGPSPWGVRAWSLCSPRQGSWERPLAQRPQGTLRSAPPSAVFQWAPRTRHAPAGPLQCPREHRTKWGGACAQQILALRTHVKGGHNCSSTCQRETHTHVLLSLPTSENRRAEYSEIAFA